jgi:hypothetical protein
MCGLFYFRTSIMAFNGSGVFSRLYSWVADAAAGINITASRMDADSNDIANAFNNCVTRDGQGTFSADINANSYRLKGLSLGTLANPSVTPNGGTNTGLYFPSVGTVGMSIAGVQSMYWDANLNTNLAGALNQAPPVSLASAATVAIGGAASNNITITGTNSISAFDTVAAGIQRMVTFSGALSLTYNATSMILPGGTSITTAAGDVACFVSLGGGNWRCLYYTPAAGSSGTISSINGGQIGGFRNPIINGDFQVQSRSAVNLTSSAQYGICNQWMVLIAGGTAISGTDAVSTGLTTTSGNMYGTTSGSWTTGAFNWQQRIEAANTTRFNGKALMLTAKLYQNTGGSRTFACALYKANTRDNFSATTLVQTSATTVSVASGAYVDGSFAFTALGSTDASNGLMFVIYDNATNTVVSKSYLIGDVRVDLGSTATPFETLDYSVQSLRCQRYLPSFRNVGGQYETACDAHFFGTNTVIATFKFQAVPRIPPTGVTMSSGTNWYFEMGGGAYPCNGSPTLSNVPTPLMGAISIPCTAALTAGQAGYLMSALGAVGTSTIYFTGAEL